MPTSFREVSEAATEAIINNHYVDDYVISFESKEEAVDITNSVKLIHSKAGFILRNFVTNCDEITTSISEENNEILPFVKKSCVEKILGLFWNHKDDTYTFLTRFNKISPEILSNSRIPTLKEENGKKKLLKK